jgi:glycosyltransferase involved in cell wall biosynthesis
LPTEDLEVASSDPDVWLWDFNRGTVDTDRPVIAVIHEAPGEDELLAPALLEQLDRVGRLAGERADRVVTCSSVSRGRIAQRYGVGLDAIDVAPYGVDQSVFRPDGPVATELVRAAGGNERPYVLFVGSVLPRKNLPLLRSVMAEMPTHQLVVVASPCLDPESPALLQAATLPIDGRPVPNLAGSATDTLAAVMRGADVLCLPSLSEGFGLPVVEAMACGTPVVVSDRGSLPEVVGNGGVIVAPTREQLLGGLRRAIDNRAAVSRRALERAKSFTWDRTAAHVRESISRTLASSCEKREDES